jgi:NAD(P)-dependent dehydrogenase (short-subunit alcohol dehydrogenase family)
VLVNISGGAVLVTGGASGLGRATASLLAKREAAVYIADRDITRGLAVAAQLGARFIEMDVADDVSVETGMQQVAAANPMLAVVHCAGVPGRSPASSGRILDAADAPPIAASRVAEIISVNLVGTFNVVRSAATLMARQGQPGVANGVIVLTASISAIDGLPGQAVYAASKGGVIGATLPLARDLAQFGIRVVTIAPGLFDTPILGYLPPEAKAAAAREVPWPRRPGDPREFGALAYHIIENDYVNGEVIRLDGSLRTSFVPWPD